MSYQVLGSANADGTPVYGAMSNQLDRGNLLNRTAQSNNLEAQKYNTTMEDERQYRKELIAEAKRQLDLEEKKIDVLGDAADAEGISGFFGGVGKLLSAPTKGGGSIISSMFGM
jgi:hypothetical protein